MLRIILFHEEKITEKESEPASQGCLDIAKLVFLRASVAFTRCVSVSYASTLINDRGGIREIVYRGDFFFFVRSETDI